MPQVDRDASTELEALFIGCGAIIVPEKKPPGDLRDDVGDESEEEEQVRSKSNYSTRSVRQAPKKDDSDSDFDL